MTIPQTLVALTIALANYLRWHFDRRVLLPFEAAWRRLWYMRLPRWWGIIKNGRMKWLKK